MHMTAEPNPATKLGQRNGKAAQDICLAVDKTALKFQYADNCGQSEARTPNCGGVFLQCIFFNAVQSQRTNHDTHVSWETPVRVSHTLLHQMKTTHAFLLPSVVILHVFPGFKSAPRRALLGGVGIRLPPLLLQ
uniref:Uncharacterized protein n=1 Tax=Eutreptiella gymnastica TaxID=73025 RepID=A0A7S1HZS6_9EUGL